MVMWKKFIIGISVLILSVNSLFAYNECQNYVNIFIDTENSSGYIEVWYTDCNDLKRHDIIMSDSVYLCVDTNHEVKFKAIPDTGYVFMGWGTDELVDHEIVYMYYPCNDFEIYPIFKKYQNHYHYDDDHEDTCFINSIN